MEIISLGYRILQNLKHIPHMTSKRTENASLQTVFARQIKNYTHTSAHFVVFSQIFHPNTSENSQH